MQTPAANLYEFGEFQLDTGKRLLRRLDGTPVPLTSRVFDTLLFMVRHHDVVLDKERIMEVVWPDSIVEENNLAQAISKLRQVFGETPGSHSYIVTIPGRGYRFVAQVKEATASAVETAVITTPAADGTAATAPAADKAATTEPIDSLVPRLAVSDPQPTQFPRTGLAVGSSVGGNRDGHHRSIGFRPPSCSQFICSRSRTYICPDANPSKERRGFAVRQS